VTHAEDESTHAIRWDEHDLVPAVVQDANTMQVLMVGFMNQTAFQESLNTHKVHFFSRSRNRLWRKGETSGNELHVEEVRVNCEQNSLLVIATPAGPTCHTGHDSCYFRRVEYDERLTVIAERTADPDAMYGSQLTENLNEPTRLWYRAYEYLRDNDLAAESGTSRRLRTPNEPLAERLADELRELAGVLDGSHSHRGFIADVLLEGSQAIYWTALIAVRTRAPWSSWRPDRALATSDDALSKQIAAQLLRAEADAWERDPIPAYDAPARCHATVGRGAQACVAAGIEPGAILQRDLDDLRSREYLAPIFEQV